MLYKTWHFHSFLPFLHGCWFPFYFVASGHWMRELLHQPPASNHSLFSYWNERLHQTHCNLRPTHGFGSTVDQVSSFCLFLWTEILKNISESARLPEKWLVWFCLCWRCHLLLVPAPVMRSTKWLAERPLTFHKAVFIFIWFLLKKQFFTFTCPTCNTAVYTAVFAPNL